MRFLIRVVPVFFIILGGAGCLPAQKATRPKEPKAPMSRSLATVDGVPITETQARMEGAADLGSLELQNLRAKAIAARNEHRILEEALEKIIEEKLLGAEAGRRNISKEELLSAEIRQKLSEPSSDEIEKFYSENKQRITRPKEDAVPQIRILLMQQKENSLRAALLGRLEEEHKVVRLLEPLRYDVNADGRPSLGPVSAPVLLVLFSDFQCPYCKRLNTTMKEVLKRYGDRVHVVFRQFPLTSIHANAERAARASLCAQAQNRFWEMHDLLFENQNSLRDEDLKNKARKLGLNAAAFDTCLDSRQYGSTIHEDMRAAATAGVEGAPALFINGRFLYGSRPLDEISALIDEELASKNSPAGQRIRDPQKMGTSR
jgi:predicted DsbA family dithiol-disulfide isomerase